MTRKLLTALCLSLLLAPVAMGGVVMEMEIRELPSGDGPMSRIYAQGEMLRVETGEMGGPTVIFRDEALIILNTKERTYSRVDEEQAKALGQQLGGLMQQMQAQLDKMPAEQRAMAESMMKGRMPAQAALPEIKIEQAGSEKVGDYACQKYIVYQDDTKTAEIFTAEVGAAEESMEAFHAMARFSTKLLESFQGTPLAELGNHPLRLMEEVEGFPILTREFKDGRAVRETTLKSAEEKDLGDDLFSPPSGYKQADLMSMGG
jgi:hypothetical protein